MIVLVGVGFVMMTNESSYVLHHRSKYTLETGFPFVISSIIRWMSGVARGIVRNPTLS